MDLVFIVQCFAHSEVMPQ